MNTYSKLFLFFIPVLVISCENGNKTPNEIARDSIIAAPIPEPEDTAVPVLAEAKPDTVTTVLDTATGFRRRDLKTEDYIIQYPENQKEELSSHIEYVRERWQNVPNPMIATYEGNDINDYFHLNFKTADGEEYDFGDGNNDYGKYKLFEPSGHYVDNPKYLGKKFKVYWDWKLSEFPCCDGEYHEAKAYLPSITGLELIK